MNYSLIIEGFNKKKKKNVTSTITLSLSRLVLDVEDVYSIHTKTQLYLIQQYWNIVSFWTVLYFLDTVPGLMVKP